MVDNIVKNQQTMASPNKSTSALLITKAGTGDRYAFHKLVVQYQDMIFRMVYFRTRSRTDAQDLTQEIFLQAFKNLSRLEKIENFKAWLFKIAVNKVRDFHRRRLFRNMFKSPFNETDSVTFEHSESSTKTEQEFDKKEFWIQTEKLLKQLSRMEKEVFMLRFFDSLGIQEISKALKKNESTIKTHLYRALKKLKKNSSMHKLLEYKL